MDEKKVTVRLPADLHQQIEQMAEDDIRSVNAEVVYLLREMVAQLQAETQATLSQTAPVPVTTAQSANPWVATEGETPPQSKRPNRTEKSTNRRTTQP